MENCLCTLFYLYCSGRKTSFASARNEAKNPNDPYRKSEASQRLRTARSNREGSTEERDCEEGKPNNDVISTTSIHAVVH